MFKFINKHTIIRLSVLFLVAWVILMFNGATMAAKVPTTTKLFWSLTKDVTIDPNKYSISQDKNLRDNIVEIFYPSRTGQNAIYEVIRSMTLWAMIVFFVWAWASILFNRKPEDLKKMWFNLIYILVWWLFIFGANRVFGNMLNFNGDTLTMSNPSGEGWMSGIVDTVHGLFFVVLSALKAFAFFLAIVMIVLTGIRVIAAWEWEKWKKLVKWLINVIIALMIIKWIDVIYYIASDSANVVQKAADLIIDIAKIFAYIYWGIIFIMIILAWYLYVTDGWGWSNFKRASNVLVNILLSALVLFAFLLILYQIFAEFQEGGDAVTPQAFIMATRNLV